MSKVSIQGIPRQIHIQPVESYLMKLFHISLIRFMSDTMCSSSEYDACDCSIFCKCRAYNNSTLFKGFTSYMSKF